MPINARNKKIIKKIAQNTVLIAIQRVILLKTASNLKFAICVANLVIKSEIVLKIEKKQ